MLARVPIRDVRSLDDVLAFVESTRGENVIIFDVDNTLAPQGVSLVLSNEPYHEHYVFRAAYH